MWNACLIIGMLAVVSFAFAAENAGDPQKHLLAQANSGDPDRDSAQSPHGNQIQLIRNATMKITYAGRTFLTDPMLSPKGALMSFAGIASNPTVDLPFTTEDILSEVECVIVSHLHPDHFDGAASKAVSKEMPLFCQPGDEAQIASEGFKNVMPIAISTMWKGISITRINGNHGKGKILERLGKVSGFVFQAKGEPTVYWVGDSIWCKEVEDAIRLYKPDMIVTHSGGATIPGFEPIIMDAEQTLTLAGSSPKALVVAIHMEALDHCTVSRNKLRQEADKAGIAVSRLKIPGDGGVISF